MKQYILPSLKLTLLLIVLCAVAYPLFIAGVGKFAPGKGAGETLSVNGKVVGYANIGQTFTADHYFWEGHLLWITMQPVPQGLIKVPPIRII